MTRRESNETPRRRNRLPVETFKSGSRLLPLLALATSLLNVVPADAQDVVWDANLVQLEAHELAPGVYAVIPDDAAEKNPAGLPIATTSGFIVGEKGVLVVDSMLNGRLATQLIGLIRKVTSKPIRYVVNTSYHGDHSYGNYVFPATATVIQHPATKKYVEQYFDEDRAFMMQYFGKGRGIEEAVARTGDILVGDRLSIDLGGMDVEVLHLGFAQTDGDLFVWVPEHEVVWAGNPFIAEKPALPWLLDGRHGESLATMKKLWELVSESTTIVPGHGRPVKREALKFTIDYLTTLDAEVRRAVADGLSLEETVERVRVPEFGGYALFDWVHSEINVVAAYKEISGASRD